MKWFKKWFRREAKPSPVDERNNATLAAIYQAYAKVPLAFRQFGKGEFAMSEETFNQLSYRLDHPIPGLIERVYDGRIGTTAFLTGVPVAIDQDIDEGVITFRPRGWGKQ